MRINIWCVSKPAFVTFAGTLLFLLTAFHVSGSAPPPDVGFRGILDLGGSQLFSLSAEEGDESAWVAVGDDFAGYEIVTFKADDRVLILHKNGEEYSLTLGAKGVKRGHIDSDDAVVHASNLRQIGQAALIFAFSSDDESTGRVPGDKQLPGGDEVESIHDVARVLALRSRLNDTSMWIARGDAQSGNEENLTTVIDDSGQGLNPRFAAQNIVAIDFATNLHTGMPSTTPIAWTRGLREDGTWDDRGAFGSSGGLVVFMGGNVGTYRDLSSDGGALVRPDGTRTSNILEALPPEARVVGSGPASMHGSTGSQREQGP